MKKLLTTTNKVETQANYTQTLAQHHIWYEVKCVDSANSDAGIFSMFFGSSRRARGSFAEKPNLSKVYKIYVKEADSDKAKHLLNI